MLFFLRNFQNLPTDVAIASLLGIFLAVLLGMTVHEWAHNYVGYRMGDPNPKRLGKLTLNPMAHIYWPGFIMFVLIGFGILGTAPIAAHRMRNPRTGYLAAVAAGPLSNLGVAVVFALIYRIVFSNLTYDSPNILILLSIIVSYIVLFNLVLFVFNFLPFFPLDGWHIALALLPAREAIWWEKNAMNSQFVFFALLLLGFATSFDPLSMIVGQPVNFLMGILLG